ncbi:MAG: aminoglycoside phosphotransferase family protein [Candidatus Heimdallarchaeota archaeon]|nr:aminoglycoside phosphotransferase family protein [Candidatus Heimdallarchaeota archaeon]
MTTDYSVFGILNFEQFEKFCKRFHIDSKEIKTNFDGWRKLILYTEERVFLFPRDPRGVEWLDTEISAYEFLNDYANLPIPKFIDRIKDKEISFYEFAEVSRLKGMPYSKLEDKIDIQEVTKMQLNLANLFALWHNIPVQKLPQKIIQRDIFDPNLYEFEIKLLNPATTKVASDFAYQKIQEYAKLHQIKHPSLWDESIRKKWGRIIQEIVSLDDVLLHGDIHEDQILVHSEENLEITGILDWETVWVGNPIWEFNFFEWGFGIWKWWDSFLDIRKIIWKEYQKKRNLKLITVEGLSLIYTIFEFLIVLRPNTSLGKLIGKDIEESARKCIERLVRITERIEKEI